MQLLKTQKTNIIRDYLEDLVEGRAFWPREIWAQYSPEGLAGKKNCLVCQRHYYNCAATATRTTSSNLPPPQHALLLMCRRDTHARTTTTNVPPRHAHTRRRHGKSL